MRDVLFMNETREKKKERNERNEKGGLFFLRPSVLLVKSFVSLPLASLFTSSPRVTLSKEEESRAFWTRDFFKKVRKFVFRVLLSIFSLSGAPSPIINRTIFYRKRTLCTTYNDY